jgi:hypothetical protein
LSAGLPLKLQATGTITNPWYTLPPRILTWGGGSTAASDEAWDISPKCRMDLDVHGVRLFFQKDEIVFVFLGDTEAPRYLVTPIQYFICYRTFINYNVMWPVVSFDPQAFPVAESVDFKNAKSTASLSVSDLLDYLQFLNNALHYALAFYLIGCENTRYFLVEYYKAVEVIENALGGERRCIDLLGPFGVEKATLKSFKRNCNDMLRAPVDIGRHAPAPDAPLYAVDLRHLLSQPRSRSLFETSTRACRQAIDAYMKFLKEAA